MVPLAGAASPASTLVNVVFPAPDGPTKATVSPRCKVNEMSVTAGSEADRCWKLTCSNASDVSSRSGVGCAGFASFGILRMSSYTLSDASVSLVRA